MSEQLPQILEPMGSLARVGSHTEAIPTNEETTAAMMRVGSVKVGQHELQDLATIGAHVQGIGVLRVFRGRALVHQQRLTNAMQALTATIIKLEQKPKQTKSDLTLMGQLSRSLGYLSVQLTDSERLMLEVEKINSPAGFNQPVPLVRRFAPGSDVKPSQLPVGPYGVRLHHGDSRDPAPPA